VELGLGPQDIHHILFNNDHSEISLAYLIRLCYQLQNPLFADVYRLKSQPITGRKRKLNWLETSVLIQMALEEKHKTINSLKNSFIRSYYVDPNIHHLSNSTYKRTLYRAGLSLKKWFVVIILEMT